MDNVKNCLGTFREFYSRKTGMPFPGLAGEMWHVVSPRIAEALADWADAVAEHVARTAEEVAWANDPNTAAGADLDRIMGFSGCKRLSSETDASAREWFFAYARGETGWVVQPERMSDAMAAAQAQAEKRRQP